MGKDYTFLEELYLDESISSEELAEELLKIYKNPSGAKKAFKLITGYSFPLEDPTYDIKELSSQELTDLVTDWSNNKDVPRGKFYSNDGDSYGAVDNSTGDCWTETFKTKEGAIEWLNGKDPAEIEGWLQESEKLNESSYENETDPGQRLKNVYLMDRVIRSMNNEDPLYESPWLYYVEDEATDGGFEKFKEDNRDWDWANNRAKDTYTETYVGDDYYNNIVKIYKRLVKEYAPDGFMTREYYKNDTSGFNNWKENAGLNAEELEFLKQDIPEPKLFDR
jgi:hypothetical protein